MSITKSRPISLADKVLSVFLDANCTEMQLMSLISNWNKSYKNQEMNQSILSKLPFLKIIEYDSVYDDDDDSEDDKTYSSSISADMHAHEVTPKPRLKQASPLIIANIEQDDCCKFCKFEDCKLIHILSKDKYCSEFEESGHCSNFQCNLFHRPNIKLIQRLMDCFKHKDASTLKITELISIHNELFPQFISHSPNPQGITVRCASNFECKSDKNSTNINECIIEWKGIYTNQNIKRKLHKPFDSNVNSWPHLTSPDSMTSDESMGSIHAAATIAERPGRRNIYFQKKQPIIPEQAEMFKIYMKLKKEWNDKHLIKDLLQHFQQNSSIVVQDMYIPRRHRSGFINFKDKSAAQQFMQKANSNSLKCGGRTILVRQAKKQSDGYLKLHVQNIGCCVSFPEFVTWCRVNIDTDTAYNLQLINNLVNEGSGYAILCIENDVDGKKFIKELNGKPFRNTILSFIPWVIPSEYKKNFHRNDQRHCRRFSYTGNVNGNGIGNGNGNGMGGGFMWTSPHSGRRHSMTALSLMNEIDHDFVQRKTRSRLHKRHSLSSDPKNNIKHNLQSPLAAGLRDIKLTPTPPGLGQVKTGSASIDMSRIANISFKDWLCDVAKCAEYYDMFINAGFDSMDEMDPQLVTHDVLKEVGIDKIGHRVKILKAIDQFQNVINK